jgi:histidinol phosphatase-like PHP family hydrolase
MQSTKNRTIFTEPNHELLGKLGLMSIDMHYHSRYSDTMTRVDNILRKANRLGIGVSITDHNEIRGVLEALDNRYGVPIVPGIEVSCYDGPHILAYFFSVSEMKEFYENHVRAAKGRDPSGATCLPVKDLFDALENYNCVTSAAHPYGYRLSDMGLAKCIRKGFVDSQFLDRVDALETISGAAARPLNQKAALKAEELGKAVTGGSDGHTLLELGHIVSSSYSSDVETFLENILKKKNYVIGTETKLLPKILQASKIFTKHAEYPLGSIRNQFKLNIGRRARRAKEKLSARLQEEK